MARTWTLFCRPILRVARVPGFRLLDRDPFEFLQCLCLIAQADVGVLHRHPNITVPGQLAGLNQRDPVAK
ncbi:hypothetical protein [Bythopirellula goksoeyrii]|uniref:hypothetical protein n=1 Tax=Bythopirellula goksoeyrii TaxID=1400387 RepID=UPI0011CDC5F4|nr:hypothetical protein [Bythopirellula goksoeyrii]